jgi:DNA-binding NarL/FixJ family response regulator
MVDCQHHSSSERCSDRTGPLPRVVMADNHADVLEETRNLLQSEFQVVACAMDGATLLDAVAAAMPDVVLTDVQMPGMNGIEAGCEIIRRNLCGAVVVLSLYSHSHFVRKALDSGIRGYVLKEDAGEELIPALRAVLNGGRYLSRGVAQR